MVQITFLNPNTKTCHSCSSPADTSKAGSASTSIKPSSRLPPSGAGKCRAKRAKPGQDMGPYSALRPLDEALPGELGHEGWESEEDKDYRGYGWDYDPDWAPRGESPPRLGCRSVGGRGLVQDGKERSRATGGLPSGGGICRHPQVSRECWDFAVVKGAEARQRRNLRWRDLLPLQRAWFLALLVPCAHLMTLNLESSPGRGGALMLTGVSGVLEAAAHLLLPHGQRGGT